MPPVAWSSRFAAAFAVALALAAVPPPAAAQQTLRLAYLRTPEVVPLIDAEQMGYLQAQHLKLDLITLNNGPAAVAAVVSGSADIGYAANLPVISAVAEHQPVRAFVTQSFEPWSHPWEALLASARSGVKTLAELKGKTAASNATNGGCDVMIRDHLRAAGIPAASVHMAVVPFPQMKAALQLGTVDAVCAIPPFSTAIMQSPQIHPTVLARGIVANLKQLGSIAVGNYFARPDWLDKNKATAVAFMRALLAANKDLMAHPDKYHRMVEAEFKLPAALADQLPIPLNTGSLAAVAKDYQPPIDALVRTGLLAKPIPAADVVYTITP